MSHKSEHIYCHEYAEVFGCSHRWTVRYEEKQFCHQCGMLCGLNIRVFKTLKLKYNTFFDPMKLLRLVMKQREPLVVDNASYLSIRPTLIDFIFGVADLLHISTNTSFLAVYYLDQYDSPPHERFLYAATSLMLAAKSIELDEKIPFISKLRRYASMSTHPEINNFSVADFRTAECKLIQALRWNLQQTTLLDRVEYMMSLGIVDDNDSISRQSQSVTPLKEYNSSSFEQKTEPLTNLDNETIYDLIKQIESSYKTVCIKLLKDRIIFEHEQVNLSLACVAYLRKNLGLLNAWSPQLESITGVTAQDILPTVSHITSILSKKSHQHLTPKSIHLNPKYDQNNEPTKISYLNENSLSGSGVHQNRSLKTINHPQLVRISSNAFQGQY